MTARRKLSASPFTRTASVRPLERRASSEPTIYATILAKARAAGIFTLCTLAPLGALAGSVSACGAAMPVQPTAPASTAVSPPTDPSAVTAPPTGAGTTPAPLTTAIPPPTVSPTPSQP